jgi:hypothetical protein
VSAKAGAEIDLCLSLEQATERVEELARDLEVHELALYGRDPATGRCPRRLGRPYPASEMPANR